MGGAMTHSGGNNGDRGTVCCGALRRALYGPDVCHCLPDGYDQLPTRTRLIMDMRFGVGDFSNCHTLAEIGSAVGVTRERVRQIIVNGLRKLRRIEWDKKKAPVRTYEVLALSSYMADEGWSLLLDSANGELSLFRHRVIMARFYGQPATVVDAIETYAACLTNSFRRLGRRRQAAQTAVDNEGEGDLTSRPPQEATLCGQ